MAMQLMGKKEGMSQSFDDKGNVVPCTLIQVEPHVIVFIKDQKDESEKTLQLAFDKITTKDPRTIEKRVTKPLLGIFAKANVEPRRHIAEAKVKDVSPYAVGQEITISEYSEVSHVDVTGVSKGKGYQGVIKRHNFSGGRATHGSSFHRHGGSCGMRSTPGRTLPGQKKAGRMGGEVVTLQNIRVIAVNVEKNLLVLEGAVPGANGSVIYFSPALKKKKVEKKGKQKK